MVKLLELRISQLMFRLDCRERNLARFYQKVMQVGVSLMHADAACFFTPEKRTHKLSLYTAYKAASKQQLTDIEARITQGFDVAGSWSLEKGNLYVPLFVNNTLQSVLCVMNVRAEFDMQAEHLAHRIVKQLNKIFSNKKIEHDKDLYHKALVEISRVITQSDNSDDVIAEAMRMASEAAGGNCSLMFLNKDETSLKPVFSPQPGLDQSAYAAVSNRDPVFISDAYTNPLADTIFCRNKGIRSFMTLPLIIHDRAIGVMYVDYQYSHTCTEYEVSFFQEVGYQLSHVVYSLQARRELEENKNIQDRLINMMREMTNRTRLKDALGDVVNNTHEILGGKVGVSMWLLNDYRDSIKLAACRTDRAVLARKKGIKFPFDEVGNAGKIHDLLVEVHPDSGFGKFFAETGNYSNLGSPMLAEKEPMGILFLHAEEGHEWTETEKMILSTIATHAGPIIRLAQYIMLLETESKLDGLTKVFNRQHFEKTYREYSNRHIRQEKPYSLLMIDLDNFKQINDRYGHVVGDEVMRSFARIMQNTIRRSDKAFRYGGEEFVVLLPWTTRLEAEQVAERLRENIEKGNIDPPITVSIGLATYLDSTKDHQKMLELADAALYKAKNKGKNTVVYAE